MSEPGATWTMLENDRPTEFWVLSDNRTAHTYGTCHRKLDSPVWEWSAYYLNKRVRGMRIRVDEREEAMVECENALVKAGLVLEGPVSRPTGL
jgi:hypothetical protein